MEQKKNRSGIEYLHVHSYSHALLHALIVVLPGIAKTYYVTVL